MQSNLTPQASRILDLTQTLIAAGGYNGFSYADISEKIGITKASVHHHFPKKSDLVRILVQRYRAAAAEGLAAVSVKLKTPAARLDAYASWWSTCIRDGTMPICICAMLAAEMPALPADVGAEVRLHFVQLADWLASVIAAGKADKSFRARLDPAIEAETLMATVHGAMLSARACDTKIFDRSVQAAFKRLTAPS